MKKLLVSFALCLLGSLPLIGRTELVFGPGPEGPANALDAIVAVVDDDVITRRELNEAIVAAERQLRQRKGAIPARPALENQVLERLILARVQVRAAERNGITVDDATLNAAIETLAQRNNMNLTQMRQTVEKDGLSFARFRDEVRREILGARLRQKVVDARIQVSEQDVDSLQAQLPTSQNGFVADEEGGSGGARAYHIAQILIALPEEASAQQVDTARRKAEAVLARLRGGADFGQLAASESSGRQALEGGDLGWRTPDQLPTLFANIVPKLRPGQVSALIRSPSGFHIVKLLEAKGGSPAAVERRPASKGQPAGVVTETHARHILIKTTPQLADDEARQRLERARQRLQEGGDFAALARELSDDKGSAVRGGDLGWVPSSVMVPEFAREMDALQPNQISAPFKTRFGWHIVQVLERRQGQASPATDRARAREALLRRRSDEEWDLFLRRLRSEAYVEVRLPSVGAAPAQAPAKSAP